MTAGHQATWSAKDNFDSAEDDQGRPLTLDQIQVTGSVDVSRVGTYPITYTYTDSLGNTVSQTAQVTVVSSPTAIMAHDSQLIAGAKTIWSAQDNFDSAVDDQSKPLTLEHINVTGSVNTKEPGSYPVTYTYTDSLGNTVTKTVTVTVAASQAAITAHDSQLVAGN